MKSSTSVIIPQENVNDESVTLLSWSVPNGENVVQGQMIAEIETSKAVMEIEAPASGILVYSIEPGSDIDVGATLCTIQGNESIVESSETSTVVESSTSSPSNMKNGNNSETSIGIYSEVPTHFTKKALALLEDRKISPHRFSGKGLVRTQDILIELGEATKPQPSLSSKGVAQMGRSRSISSPIPTSGISFRTEKLSKSKRTEIGYLTSGYQNSLPSVLTVAIPTTGLRAAVDQHEEVSVSTTAVILFEVRTFIATLPSF